MLYVDDEGVNRNVARRMLQKLGCVVKVLSVRVEPHCSLHTRRGPTRSNRTLCLIDNLPVAGAGLPRSRCPAHIMVPLTTLYPT